MKKEEQKEKSGALHASGARLATAWIEDHGKYCFGVQKTILATQPLRNYSFSGRIHYIPTIQRRSWRLTSVNGIKSVSMRVLSAVPTWNFHRFWTFPSSRVQLAAATAIQRIGLRRTGWHESTVGRWKE